MKIVVVNHKMYFGYAQTMDWCTRLAAIAAHHPATVSGQVRVAVLPTAPALSAAIESLSSSGVAVGAQNMHWADAGPFTGEVGAAVLAEMGCSIVALGHAERRAHFHESDDDIARKVSSAIAHNLTPIVCVGEQERCTAGVAIVTCMRQMEVALARMANRSCAVIIAYEPVWAIGADEPASAEHIREVCGELSCRARADIGLTNVSLIYGGSAGPGQWGSFGSAVDGLFLGRSAHDPSGVGMVLDELWRETKRETRETRIAHGE